MSLIDIKNSTTTFASIDEPDGKVKLDTKDKFVDDYITIEADIPSKNIQVYTTPISTTNTTMTATDMKVTVSKAGTYTIYAATGCNRNSGTYQYSIYKNSTQIVSATTISTTTGACSVLTNQSLAVGDVITVYLKSASSSYRATAQFLGIVEQ